MTTVSRQFSSDDGSGARRHGPDAIPPAEDGRLSEDTVKELVQVFRLLADETRLRILRCLQDAQELNVVELCSRLRQRQPSVSHHLALLRAAGLLARRREGRNNYYRLLPGQLEEMLSRSLASSPGRFVSLRVGGDDGSGPPPTRRTS